MRQGERGLVVGALGLLWGAVGCASGHISTAIQMPPNARTYAVVVAPQNPGDQVGEVQAVSKDLRLGKLTQIASVADADVRLVVVTPGFAEFGDCHQFSSEGLTHGTGLDNSLHHSTSVYESCDMRLVLSASWTVQNHDGSPTTTLHWKYYRQKKDDGRSPAELRADLGSSLLKGYVSEVNDSLSEDIEDDRPPSSTGKNQFKVNLGRLLAGVLSLDYERQLGASTTLLISPEVAVGNPLSTASELSSWLGVGGQLSLHWFFGGESAKGFYIGPLGGVDYLKGTRDGHSGSTVAPEIMGVIGYSRLTNSGFAFDLGAGFGGRWGGFQLAGVDYSQTGKIGAIRLAIGFGL